MNLSNTYRISADLLATLPLRLSTRTRLFPLSVLPSDS
jgi:hypothetical protein